MTSPETDKLSQKFLKELDKLCSLFISTLELSYSKENEQNNSSLFRWMDFRLRYIDPIPRRVAYSDNFPKQLPLHIGRALKKLEAKLITGEDVNPYQNKGIKKNNPISHEPNNRTDLLWADWKIQHIHLTEKDPAEGEYFSPRSGWQLFFIVEGDEIFLIDAIPHLKNPEYANKTLLETVQRCLPSYLSRYELNGVVPAVKNFSTEEIHQLRHSGITTFTTIGDKVYVGPGGGITTAGTSTLVTIYSGRVMDSVEILAEYVSDPENDIQKHIQAEEINNPIFSFLVVPRGLAIYEKKSNFAFLLPRTSLTNNNTLTQLHDLLLPANLAKFIASKHPKK